MSYDADVSCNNRLETTNENNQRKNTVEDSEHATVRHSCVCPIRGFVLSFTRVLVSTQN